MRPRQQLQLRGVWHFDGLFCHGKAGLEQAKLLARSTRHPSKVFWICFEHLLIHVAIDAQLPSTQNSWPFWRPQSLLPDSCPSWWPAHHKSRTPPSAKSDLHWGPQITKKPSFWAQASTRLIPLSICKQQVDSASNSRTESTAGTWVETTGYISFWVKKADFLSSQKNTATNTWRLIVKSSSEGSTPLLNISNICLWRAPPRLGPKILWDGAPGPVEGR